MNPPCAAPSPPTRPSMRCASLPSKGMASTGSASFVQAGKHIHLWKAPACGGPLTPGPRGPSAPPRACDAHNPVSDIYMWPCGPMRARLAAQGGREAAVDEWAASAPASGTAQLAAGRCRRTCCSPSHTPSYQTLSIFQTQTQRFRRGLPRWRR